MRPEGESFWIISIRFRWRPCPGTERSTAWATGCGHGTERISIRMRKILGTPDRQMDSSRLDEKALMVKQVLSLLIAQRRPTEFLLRIP